MTNWMTGFWQRGLRFVLGTLLTAGLAGVPVRALPFAASGTISQFFSNGGNAGQGNGTETAAGATWDHFFDGNNGLTALNSAVSANGTLRTLATVTMDYGGWESGGLMARSSASLIEEMLPDWGAVMQHALTPDVARVIMDFEVLATGMVLATSDDGPASTATIDYQMTVGDANASGSRQVTSGAGMQESGTWGTVLMTSTVPFQSSINLNLIASATASAGKTYLSFPQADAVADFLHTLRWGGVRRIIVVTQQGQQIDITGSYVPILGSMSGFDYYYAAPSADAGIPEPSTTALLALGLIGQWWRQRCG